MVKKVLVYNVSRFLTHFNERGFKLIVLRGYEGLPDNYGGDLDIEVPAFQYHYFVKELINFSKQEGLRLFKYVWRPHVSSFKFYRVVNGALERFILDVTFRGGMWYGFQYLSNEELFLKARDRGKYLIPDPLHELCLKIFTNMLIGSSPPTKYLDELSSRLPLLRREFLDFVRSRFPGFCEEELYKALVERDVDRLKHFIPKLKLALIKRGLRKQPFRSLKWMFGTIFAELYFYLQKNGLKIVLFSKDASVYAYEDKLDGLKRMIGHVWKKIIFVRPDEAMGDPLSGFRWIFEMFRDRLIVTFIADRFGATRQELSGETYIEGEPAYVVLILYKELEKRNKLRYQNFLYRTLLWRFTYSDIYGKWLED